MRAGDANHLQLPGRIADECLAKLAIHDAAIRNDALRHIEYRQLTFADDRDRAAARSFRCVVVTIFVRTGDRDINVARSNLSPITRATGRTNIRWSNAVNAARQKLAERHAMP